MPKHPSAALVKMLAEELYADGECETAIPKARAALNNLFGVPLDDNPDHQITRKDVSRKQDGPIGTDW